MILGILILKKQYSIREYISIALISVGICMSTLASTNDYKKALKSEDTIQKAEHFMSLFWWIFGKFIKNMKIKKNASDRVSD